MDRDREQLLMAELHAIEYWEDSYRREKVHDIMAFHAHCSRLKRREEILHELLDIVNKVQ